MTKMELIEIINSLEPNKNYRPKNHENDVWCSGWKTPDCDMCEEKIICRKIDEIKSLIN